MARNSIGKNLTITSFGESHGTAIGVVIDGYPSNVEIDMSAAFHAAQTSGTKCNYNLSD
jgi:chorismate synthase